jgi:hypothetical protein
MEWRRNHEILIFRVASIEKTFTYLDRNFTWVRVFWKIELLKRQTGTYL